MGTECLLAEYLLAAGSHGWGMDGRTERIARRAEVPEVLERDGAGLETGMDV